jgi:hypothetical protein
MSSYVPIPADAAPIEPEITSATEMTPEMLETVSTDSVLVATPESARELRPDVTAGKPLTPSVMAAGEE